jgi:hypothetical protein
MKKKPSSVIYLAEISGKTGVKLLQNSYSIQFQLKIAK